MSTSNISSRTVSTKQSRLTGPKPTTHRKRSSLDENVNVTVRLSDLGIKIRSHSEADLLIQHSRVSYILDNVIKKLQLAVCLPRLLRRDACLLRRFVTDPQEIEFILVICSKYYELSTNLRVIDKQSLAAMLSVVDNISKTESKKKYSKYTTMEEQNSFTGRHMARIMQMLWNNQGLKDMVLAEFSLIPENPSTIFVNSIKTLKDVIDFKLGVSANEERLRERQLRRAWNATSLIEQNILKTQNLLDKQRNDIGNQLEARKKIVLNYENKLQALKDKMREEIKHTVMDSQKEMGEDTHFSELRQIDLSQEAKGITQQYEGLLTQHMNIEKLLRAKRFKIETQLCSWLAKYDADIGERQAEFEIVSNGYEAEKADMDEIQDLINEQDREYQTLMAQKEEEEEAMWEERAYEYLKNRSARKIQRCWRAYRQRKIDRRNAKKAKALEKKRKAAEKAARKAAGEEEPKEEKEKGKKAEKKGKKGKGKKDKLPPSDGRGPDFQAALEGKFGEELLGDLQGEEFSKKEVVVDLEEDLDD